MRLKYWITVAAGILLGLIFLTSGIGKILAHSSFLISVSNLAFFPDIVQTLIVDWLPWGEVVLGVLLVSGTCTQLVSLLSCILIGCFMFQNTWMIMNGMRNEPCHCFGVLDRIPIDVVERLDLGVTVAHVVVRQAFPVHDASKLVIVQAIFDPWAGQCIDLRLLVPTVVDRCIAQHHGHYVLWVSQRVLLRQKAAVGTARHYNRPQSQVLAQRFRIVHPLLVGEGWVQTCLAAAPLILDDHPVAVGQTPPRCFGLLVVTQSRCPVKAEDGLGVIGAQVFVIQSIAMDLHKHVPVLQF